jgi:hypothetical protein
MATRILAERFCRAQQASLVWKRGLSCDRELAKHAGGLRQAWPRGWLASTNPQVYCTGQNAVAPGVVNQAQFSIAKREGNGLLLAAVEMQALKSLQCAKRSAGNPRARKVELHNLIAGNCAGVRNVRGYSYGIIDGEARDIDA